MNLIARSTRLIRIPNLAIIPSLLAEENQLKDKGKSLSPLKKKSLFLELFGGQSESFLCEGRFYEYIMKILYNMHSAFV